MYSRSCQWQDVCEQSSVPAGRRRRRRRVRVATALRHRPSRWRRRVTPHSGPSVVYVLPGRNKVIPLVEELPRRATSGLPPPFRNGLARQSPFITRNSPPFEEGGIRSIPAAPLRSPPSWRSKKNSSRIAVTRSKPNSLSSFLPFNVSQCIISLHCFHGALFARRRRLSLSFSAGCRLSH